MAWTPFTKLTTYLSGRRVGTQPGQANLNAELDNVYTGINAAGEAVDTHAASGDHDGRYYTKTQADATRDDLAGAGRTTETIKGAYTALQTHQDDPTAHGTYYYTKTQLDEGALDSLYPTRTDMAAAIANASLGVQTTGVVTNRTGAAEHWTLQQSDVNKFRYELDADGNLLQKRWNGSAWVTVFTVTLSGGAVSFAGAVTASGALTASSGLSVTGTTSLGTTTATTVTASTSVAVNGAKYWGKLSSAPSTTNAGDFYYNTSDTTYYFYTGSAWTTFGLTQAQVQAIARTEALKAGGA